MTKAQGWAAVPPTEGGIAINIGDMLSRWSDGRLHSNLHRVRMPTPEENSPPRSRYSMAFFMQVSVSNQPCPRLVRYSMAFFMQVSISNSVLTCMPLPWQADKKVLIESKHGTISAGDYILGRIRSNFEKK